jgi:hypothetical protein
LALLVLVVIVVDPNARQKATALVNRWEPTLEKWDKTILVNAPSIHVSKQAATPAATLTPAPTELVDNDDEHLIPTTGGEDTQEKPIIQINWDAFKAAMQRFWDDLREDLHNIKIDIKKDNK